MPWSRLASRTPLGSLTLTIPLCRKNSDDAGSPAHDALPGLIAARGERGQVGELLVAQSGEQCLFAEMGASSAAMKPP